MTRTKKELHEALQEALKIVKQLEAKNKSLEAQVKGKQEKVEVKIYKVWTKETKNGKNQVGDVHILNEKQATNQWNNYLKSFDSKNKPSGTIKQLINNKVEILETKQWYLTTKKPNGKSDNK